MQIVETPDLGGRVRVFRDRAHAGRVLGALARTVAPEDAVVLAIPAGGVPVAVEVARALGAALDVAVVSKITFPWNTESGYGAVAFDGSVVLDEARAALVEPHDIERGIASTRARVERRVRSFRAGREPLSLAGRTAVLVDDGIAAGLTLRAGIAAVRRAGAARVMVAVPTAHESSLARLDADMTVCPNVRAGASFAVADAYQSWFDVDEAEALRLVTTSRNVTQSS